MVSYRIAFLTPEYVSEAADRGGLANYIRKMAGVLRGAGHEAEVFVLSDASPQSVEHDGVRVHRVRPAVDPMHLRIGFRIARSGSEPPPKE